MTRGPDLPRALGRRAAKHFSLFDRPTSAVPDKSSGSSVFTAVPVTGDVITGAAGAMVSGGAPPSPSPPEESPSLLPHPAIIINNAQAAPKPERRETPRLNDERFIFLSP